MHVVGNYSLKREQPMRLATLGLAAALAFTSTLALAQSSSGGSSSAAGGTSSGGTTMGSPTTGAMGSPNGNDDR